MTLMRPAFLCRRLPVSTFKERQQIVVAPTWIAACAPAVVGRAAAANVHHGVDRARTTVHFAARHCDSSTIQAGFGFCGVVPVVRRAHEGDPTSGCEDCGVGLTRYAGFEEQYPDGRIEREAMNERAARRACADDDDVGLSQTSSRRHLRA